MKATILRLELLREHFKTWKESCTTFAGFALLCVLCVKRERVHAKLAKTRKVRKEVLKSSLSRTQIIFFNRRALAAYACLAWAALFAQSAGATEIANDRISLKLGFGSDTLPVIEQATWVGTDEPVFTNLQTAEGLGAWVPENLVPVAALKTRATAWRVTEDENFFIARTSRDLARGVRMYWVVELAKQGALVRLHVCLKNTGEQAQAIEWFPAWTASWNVADAAKWVRWWESLSFKRVQQDLSSSERIKLDSRLHSSDIENDGVNPYWVVGGKSARLFFGLEWCGGWEAKLKSTDKGGLAFSVRLPPEETQLTLEPGETVVGPALIISPEAEADEMNSRYVWMAERQSLGQSLYGGPPPAFPLTYNHWYSARFDVDSDFLKRQVAAMSPYGFDAFIVDAGWYESVGRWEPDLTKFQPGEFEDILQSVKSQGALVGIWSCPQFVSVNGDDLPSEVDSPAFFEDFLDAYLLDLDGSNFKERLTGHVGVLRGRYSADWWKYDQALFKKRSRAGAMKNVIAFQDALRAVRQENPDLVIENCQSGGRMINELTLLATQVSWLKDGGDNGMDHAHQNIESALGAMEFIFPWSVYRWTNDLEGMSQKDDDLTRFYCRSAMAGVWGISSDLSAIGAHQRSVILKEVENYRKLNELKRVGMYELIQPADSADVAGVIFYDPLREGAAVLLYRWGRAGQFDYKVTFNKLKSKTQFRITDIDTGITFKGRGKNLVRNGVTVSFPSERLSALLFIEPAG